MRRGIQPSLSRLAGARGTLPAKWLAATATGILVLLAARGSGGTPQPAPRPPGRLAETGLYADFSAKIVRPENLPYEPQYPLWSDGAAKRRWIHLPPGTAIDASDPNQWRFPVGTKMWKEFSYGRPVETRYMELTESGAWIFASYAWSADGSEATLAPDRGIRGVCEIRPAVRHDIPGYYDCLACHEGQPNRVLGFSALQLSTDRDPLSPHAIPPAPGSIDLAWLIEQCLIRGLPESYAKHPPRIEAPTPTARAALGYLHANCSPCHNSRGPLASLDFSLEVVLSDSGGTDPQALATAVDRPSRFRPPGSNPEYNNRIVSGDPAHSVVVERMSSRIASVQMPPLGTHLQDAEAVALVSAWIGRDVHPQKAVILSTSKP